MPLLDRVGTLIRANLNDLVDKAENPEKLLKQLLLDMQNQFMQVKTQVAIAIADQHLLEKKHRESLQTQKEWVAKAELAVAKNQEALARSALERSITFENASKNFAQQLEDQNDQVEMLRNALQGLEQKMAETKTKADLLIAQHRLARLAMAAGARSSDDFARNATLDRIHSRVVEAEALGRGHQLAAAETSTERRLAQFEKSDRVDRLLAELKGRIAGRAV
jgi:phage shock protein A